MVIAFLIENAPLHRGMGEIITGWVLSVILSIFYVAGTLVCFVMSFPKETCIDTRQRTFRLVTRRWLWGRTVLKGSLNEMAGICITNQGNVLLVFKTPRRFLYGIGLGRSSQRGQAEALAEQFCAALEMPRIKYAG